MNPERTCPTCGDPAESLSRYLGGGPAFVQPCGHFVRLEGTSGALVTKPHPEYGIDIREQDLRSDWWEVWRLTVSRNGNMPRIDPPLRWVEHYRRQSSRGSISKNSNFTA